MISVLATLLFGLSLPASGPAAGEAPRIVDWVSVVAAGPNFAAIDSDSDLPSKEVGLPGRIQEDEGEEEDGDRDDAKTLGPDFSLATFALLPPARTGSAALRPATGGRVTAPRTPCLRC